MAATAKEAAVLLLLSPCSGGCTITLTKRMRNLDHHGGEVSFPGGMMEEDDLTLRDTALRETYEEMGIDPYKIRILGVMDDELSRWGHRVTPYVGYTDAPITNVHNTEVERVYQVPVSHFMRDDVFWTEKWLRNGGVRTVYFYRYKDDIVWGLTGRIINKFIECFIL